MAPDPALNAQRSRPLEQTQALRWAELAADAAEPNCFYAPEMLLPALQHLAGHDEVRLVEIEEQGQLIGLVPLAVQPRHGRLPVANIANWMHHHCFFGAPLIRRGHEHAAWAGFLAQCDAASWAPAFLHLRGLDAAGANAAALEAVCAAQARPVRELLRYDRALLRSPLDADSYWEENVRPKKRKELRRLQKRLAELGELKARSLTTAGELSAWCDAFLDLEASGWKGREGTALRCSASDTAFFRAAAEGAFAAGLLNMLRLDLDGRAIAMLVNFHHGAGAFSFKIAIDEALGRFSPGVLIEIENLRAVQGDAAIAWMDSCAAADHPMIDSLWAERRSIVQYRVCLRGRGVRRTGRAIAFAAADAVERIGGFVRREPRD